MDVKDGAAAVSRARQENLDAIVLVSTGTEMDLTETALNLRDIHPSAQLILLADLKGAAEMASIAQALPKTKIVSVADLSSYLASAEWQWSTEKRRAVEDGNRFIDESRRKEK